MNIPTALKPIFSNLIFIESYLFGATKLTIKNTKKKTKLVPAVKQFITI